jgi:hypothetical protein
MKNIQTGQSVDSPLTPPEGYDSLPLLSPDSSEDDVMDEDVDDMEAEVLTGPAASRAGACTSTLSLAVAVTRVVVMRLG